ncbi:MAG TPA: hypothetical protein VHQ90_12090 [Thermoanaerobaculia bacterium]|nr:hypothetical protein [Thermoanaerobaculia bacterium]
MLGGSGSLSSVRSRRSKPWSHRLLAAALLLLFLGAAVTTTVISLGRYCLTTDGSDTRALPGGLRGPAAGGNAR